MSIEGHIINDIESCNLDHKIGDLQHIFNELTYSHLPVEHEGVFLGSISENDVRCFEAQKTLRDYQYALENFFVRSDSNWIDTLETFAQNHANIVPVLDEKNLYVGYLELNDILSIFNETPFLNEAGGIIVVEKGHRDYSFSEIGQIVESNNAVILGMFISSKEENRTQITIKVSSPGFNDMLQAFRRYGYTVISEHKEDAFNKNLEERSQYLDKYLNI